MTTFALPNGYEIRLDGGWIHAEDQRHRTGRIRHYSNPRSAEIPPHSIEAAMMERVSLIARRKGAVLEAEAVQMLRDFIASTVDALARTMQEHGGACYVTLQRAAFVRLDKFAKALGRTAKRITPEVFAAVRAWFCPCPPIC